ncbi:gamma-glutamyl-gamma-aminobutyrate hydrolase family protein [Brachybacterium sp. EF45031]|uniref:gamma-glutamyl-gamma-aminobutyrate hydrolase family protein n=1 Tax=Brachybacterium sillae TaxID=2810536 RepID=UPI00217D2DBF|nr:gamma-glutamyl-gamma-aminobutyrate hydrolase family protein [Brachybacterium sillae]MCS6712562.1 gamma-glutamyl-gamma-aminobutyrate hydrolase family protein [Brachybacterium sillae]
MTASSPRRPLIGVTAGRMVMPGGAWAGHPAVAVTEHYVRALREAGARVVILAPQDPWSDTEVAELDGLVLTGGNDLDPTGWGAEALPTDLPADPERDAFEADLYRAARRVGIPVLGICRGLQIIATAEGGDLVRHLPADVPAHPDSSQRPTEVEVDVDAASDLALALGTRPTVTAYHHQAAGRIPDGLRPVAHHASGVVMALESAEGSPVLAVQWHPELDRRAEALFARFVDSTIRGSRPWGERTTTDQVTAASKRRAPLAPLV